MGNARQAKGSKGGRNRHDRGRQRQEHGVDAHREGGARQAAWVGYVPQAPQYYSQQMAYPQQSANMMGYYPQIAMSQMGFQGMRMAPSMPNDQVYQQNYQQMFQHAIPYNAVDMRNQPVFQPTA